MVWIWLVSSGFVAIVAWIALSEVFRHPEERTCSECGARRATIVERECRFCEYSRTSTLHDYDATCRRCGHSWSYTRREGMPGYPPWKGD